MMPHSPTSALNVVASHIPEERLVVARAYVRDCLRGYGTFFLSPEGGEVLGYEESKGDPRLNSALTWMDGLRRVGMESAVAVPILKEPSIWLVRVLWWLLNADFPKHWLDVVAEWHDPSDLADLVSRMFAEGTISREILTAHLSATHKPEDRDALLAGCFWSLGQLSILPASLLIAKTDAKALDMPNVAMQLAGQALLDLDTKILSEIGTWAEIRDLARAERGAEEDGGQGTEGEE